MAQQIINTGANANDGTGEPLREAFTAVNDNFTEIYTAGPVGSNVQIVGNTITTLQINQNLTLKPNGIGKIQANAAIIPSVNLVYDLGSSTQQWDSVYAGYFIGNGALLTGISGGNASNSFSTISANGVTIVANSATGVLTLTPGNNITIVGSAASDTVTFGVSSSPVFSGNVSGGNFLTGGTVSAAGNITGANLRTTGSISTAGNITANNVVFSGNLVGNISTNGNVIAGNVIATQAIIAATDITSAANITGNYIFGNGAFLTGISGGAGNYSNANVSAFLPTYTGNVSAAYFIGNGSQLTSVTGANVVGIVSRANIANVAYSVAGANVVGSVDNANYAGFANLAYTAYGNGIIGSVATANVANVAYSVSGANVVGTVANATYAVTSGSAATAATANTANTANIANVAYSVAGANVTGNVANATYAEYANLAYNAYGNGIIGSVSSANTANIANVAYSVSGANVVGTVANATYAVSAGSAGSANTANQANIANIANVAYSVAGANVTGNVANATYAEYANLAYYAYGNGIIGSVSSANTANTANIANLAYSVSGANVVGTVANATYAVSAGSATTANTANIANVAYSVAGANVTGNVANATYAEYANLAYYAYGNGIVGQISTTSNIVGGNISTAGNVTGNYFFGNGSQLTGVVATDIGVLTSLSVTGNAQIGNVRTAGQVSATGNVTTGNYFVGNGAFLTGIVASAGSEITNDLSNVRIGGANANVTVSVNAVSNVAVFTTGGMSTTGNIIANANVLANGQISALGNVTGNYIFGNGALLTGVITSVANINNGTSNVTVVSSGGNITVGVNGTGNVAVFANTGAYVAGVVSASGNVTANYFIGNGSQLTGIDATSIQNGNSNVKVYANGNVSTSINGISNVVVVSDTGQYITGLISASGNILGSNVSTGILSATGNITGGNLLTAGVISATGNITGENLSAVNLVINNIASDDSSYVTIEDGLTVVGEILAAGNVTGGNVNTNNIVGTGLTITSTGLLNLAPTGNITVNAKNINNLADPVQDQDAATKAYVDNVAQGLDPKASVAYATAATLPAYTYNNGTAGVGATITGSATGLLTIDGTAPTVGDRVLIKNETSANAPYNGIYTVTTNSAGSAYVLTRATDFNQASEIPSAFTFVEYGTINGDTGWVCSTNAPVVVGTTDIVFVQFSGAGSYTANTAAGLSLIGSQFNAKVDENTTAFDGSGNIIVKAGANLTTPNIGAATGTSLSVSGNIRVGNIVIPSTGNINVANVNIVNLASPVANSDAATKAYVDSQAGNVSGNVIGNLIPLGTPSDSSLTTNVAYPGWTTATFVTDGLDDLNQVALNIAKNTFVGQASLSGTPLAGPSPTTVAFTGSYIGNVNSHLWNFGDGTTSTSANPSKTYSNVQGGQFTVTYTAYNTNGTFNGNAANGAKGSVSSFTATNYITLYTPTPISAFTVANSSIDTGSSAQISNASQYANYFELNWGDGSANVNFANGWTTQSHVYNNSANTDSRYGIVLTATSNTAGPANVSTVSSTSFVKVYSPQSPAFTANTLSVINYAATSGGVVSFRNDTPGSPGTTAVYGAQQLYNWQWGDGTANSNINIQAGLAGNPGAANITHTFALSAGQQAAGTTVNYTANLWLYTGYSTSPFQASNVTITVEPEVRANFLGTANIQSDASGATAQTGYIYTDYNGNNRAEFSFQNTSQLANLYNWSFGDSTFANGISNTANVNKTYTSTGSYTVALTANGTPGTTAQSNTQTRTNYITIAANPAAPGALSTKTISMSTASEGTSPLLAAGATDNTGGNIPSAGASVTRYVTATPVISTTASSANTSTTGTLTALVNNTVSGNTPFTVGTSNTGTFTNLVVTQDADAHSVISATYPTGFYKVFSAYVSKSLASLSTGYSDYKLSHSTTGNTNATGFVKDNLTATPTLSNATVTMAETTAGTYRYISGVPYYNTGSPAISVNSLAVSNLTGQTYRSTSTPVTVLSGTNYESTSGSIISAQTKTYAQIDGPVSMLTGGIPNANVGIASAYTLGNLAISINGSAQAVATLGANIINVNGTSATIQLPTKIQVYSTALTGFDESNIAVAAGLGSVYTDNAIRISGIGSGNTPAFSNSTNFYTANAWSGAVTMTGTDEAVVRWGTLKHFNSADFSTGYLPVGPDLVTGRSGIQYFTFAFRRATMASFDIILTTTTGIAGLWVAAPGTTIDKGGFSSPTPGYPGPTSTLNGWLTGFQQYNGAGVPGASATGGNPAGTNGCALTGADVIPLNTAISNQRYTMTLGSQNSSNSTGNNVLIRIGLSSGQTLTSVAIGLPT